MIIVLSTSIILLGENTVTSQLRNTSRVLSSLIVTEKGGEMAFWIRYSWEFIIIIIGNSQKQVSGPDPRLCWCQVMPQFFHQRLRGPAVLLCLVPRHTSTALWSQTAWVWILTSWVSLSWLVNLTESRFAICKTNIVPTPHGLSGGSISNTGRKCLQQAHTVSAQQLPVIIIITSFLKSKFNTVFSPFFPLPMSFPSIFLHAFGWNDSSDSHYYL